MYNEGAVVKCDACGADMAFDPEKGCLVCQYCGGTREIERRIPIMREYLTERADGVVTGENTGFECPNCGASVEMAGFSTALKCPFCGATNILKRENMHGLRPDSILPFGISKEKAAVLGKKWIKKKLFAPGKLKKEFKGDSFNGVYVPLFSFYASTFSSYAGRFGDVRTRVVGSGKNQRVETYTVWYNVSGTLNKDFNDLLIEASAQIDQNELSKILPFDMSNAEAYNREYISGFTAERYDTSLDSSFDKAKGIIGEDIRKTVVNKYHPDKIDYLNINTGYDNIKFRYLIAPLWVCAYKFKDKLMRFLVNGRTGKATGKAPVSPIRVSALVFFCLGLAALFIWLFGFSGLIFN